MAEAFITSMPVAAALAGGELIEVSQPSTTVVYTATTISALASDNAFVDSAAQFIVEGFEVGNRVRVTGFTGDVANNIFVGLVTALLADKMTIGGTDGDVIVDDAAGESVTITKWESRRLAIGNVVELTKDTDTTLAANSDARLATQKAVKTYVDGKVTGLLDDKGDIDCSANPNYPAASKGDAYHVTVAGKIGGASGPDVDIGDVIAAKADNAGGTHAGVGASWYILEHNLSGVAMLSGATFTGDIIVPAEAYDATNWNGNNEAPTKNDVRDKIEAVVAGTPGAYTGGLQAVPILAGAMTPRTTNGAAAGTTETTTNKLMLSTLDFDASTIEYAQFLIPMPKSWNESTVTATFIWTAASGSGDVIWGLQAIAVSEADPLDVAFGTAQEVTDSLTTALDNHTSAATAAITVGGTPQPEDLVAFQVYRNASDGSDTLGVDAKLIAVVLKMTTNAADDS